MSDIIDHPGAPRNTALQNFILYRELNEVYLLLDHISGRSDKSFSAFENRAAGDDGGHIPIRQICEIRWPSPDDQTRQAEMAEVLLRAKDKLNAAARPANGLTIAFTLMVVGERDSREVSAEGGSDAGDAGGGKGNPPTRVSLAQEAFPGMIESAIDFRRRIRSIVYFLTFLLFMTCLLSWYTATMNGILTHMDTVHAQGRELENKMALMVVSSSRDPAAIKEVALAQAATKVGANAPAPHPARTADGGAAYGLSQFSSNFCNKNLSQVSASEKPADAIAMCSALNVNRQEHMAIWNNLGYWLPWRVTRTDEGRASDEEGGRIITQLLINSILPFFYGVLGAGAAVVRDLWAKTRESLLSPRDSTLAFGQLALGAIIGACIGLFVNPTSAGVASGGVLASLALTASALAFVAGFGVEGAFLALESLVRRVFNQTGPADSRSQPR